MTQPVPFPAPEATAPMDPQHHQHPDQFPPPSEVSAPDEPSEASAPDQSGEPQAPRASGLPPSQTLMMQPPGTATPHSKLRRMPRVPVNPLLAIFGVVVALLFGFALTQTNDRISRLDDRVLRLDDKVDAGFTKMALRELGRSRVVGIRG